MGGWSREDLLVEMRRDQWPPLAAHYEVLLTHSDGQMEIVTRIPLEHCRLFNPHDQLQGRRAGSTLPLLECALRRLRLTPVENSLSCLARCAYASPEGTWHVTANRA